MPEGTKAEGWSVPLPFAEARDYVEGVLPINERFDEAPYRGAESGMDISGQKKIEWTWATDGPGTYISVGVRQISDSSMVTIAYLGR